MPWANAGEINIPTSHRRSAEMLPRTWRRGEPDDQRSAEDQASAGELVSRTRPAAALRDHLASLLKLGGTSARQVEQGGRRAYETLQPCLRATD